MNSSKGDPVLMLNIIFIVGCVIWGGFKLIGYIDYLEDTVHDQQKAIELQQNEIRVLRQFITPATNYNIVPNSNIDPYN